MCYKIILLLIVVIFETSCQPKKEKSHRETINLKDALTNKKIPIIVDKAIYLKMLIQDSIEGLGLLDFGGDTTRVFLDSTFCSKHAIVAEVKESASVQFQFSYQAHKLHRTKDSIKIAVDKYCRNFQPLINDFTSFPAYNKRPILGLMGLQLFKEHIIELNIEKGYLSMHDEINKDSLKSCNLLQDDDGTLEIKINLKVNDSTVLNGVVMIDPGDDGFLVNGIRGHQKILKSLDSKPITFDYSYGKGFSTDFYRISALEFGGYTIKNKMAYNFGFYSPQSNNLGNVGLDFLKRFILYFDLKNNKLYFKPSKLFNERNNHKLDSFVISSQKTSKGYQPLIKGLLRSNYIKEAGLQLNDEVVELNGVPQDSLSQSKVDSIRHHVKIGEEYNFLIKRKGKLLRKILIKKDIL